MMILMEVTHTPKKTYIRFSGFIYLYKLKSRIYKYFGSNLRKHFKDTRFYILGR